MKSNRRHSTGRKIAITGVSLLVLLLGFAAFRGGSNPKPTITISLISEIDLVTNRVATLVLSNSGPGTIAIDVWRSNAVDGWLEAYAATGKIDTTEIRLSWIPPTKILRAGETLQFVETIPAVAEKWRYHADGRDPRRVDRIMKSPALMKVVGLLDDLPLPDAFWELVRGESEWTLDIESPWFRPDAVSNDPD